MIFQESEKRINKRTGRELALILVFVFSIFMVAPPTFAIDHVDFPPLFSIYLFVFLLFLDIVVLAFVAFRYLTRRSSICLLFLLVGFTLSVGIDISLLYYHPVYTDGAGLVYKNIDLVVNLFILRSLLIAYFMAVASVCKVRMQKKISIKHLAYCIVPILILVAFTNYAQDPDSLLWSHIHPGMLFYVLADIFTVFFVLMVTYFYGGSDSFWAGMSLFASCMYISLQYGVESIRFEDNYWGLMLSIQLVGYFIMVVFFMKNSYDRLKISMIYGGVIYEKSITDPLTGIYNRGFFMDSLNDMIENKQNEAFALYIADIDHFKSINDRFGHVTGDKVIQSISKELASKVGDLGCVARIGGEEFAILISTDSGKKVRELASDIVSHVRDIPPIENGDYKHHVTISLGVYISKGEDSDVTALSRADDALYYVKNHGRNNFAVYCDMAQRSFAGMAALDNKEPVHS